MPLRKRYDIPCSGKNISAAVEVLEKNAAPVAEVSMDDLEPPSVVVIDLDINK